MRLGLVLGPTGNGMSDVLVGTSAPLVSDFVHPVSAKLNTTIKIIKVNVIFFMGDILLLLINPSFFITGTFLKILFFNEIVA